MELSLEQRMSSPKCERCGHILLFAGFWDGTDKSGHIHYGFLYHCRHCGNEVVEED